MMSTASPLQRRTGHAASGITFGIKFGSAVSMSVFMIAAWAADAPSPSAGFRCRAEVRLEQPGAFVALPLPASVYACSQQTGLSDLRLVDAQGQRVPLALLPDAPSRSEIRRQDVRLYALPVTNPTNATVDPGKAQAPTSITLHGADRQLIRIELPAAPAFTPATTQPTTPTSPGWLIDLGESHPEDRPLQAVELDWSGPAEFNAAFELSVSHDLQHWQAAGHGQLLELHGDGERLRQNRILPSTPSGRYLLLRWRGGEPAPALTSAKAERSAVPSTADSNRPLSLQVPATSGADATQALDFDLGHVMPLTSIDLMLPTGQRVVPVRWQMRQTPQQPWQSLGAHVHYRLEHRGEISRSQPLSIETRTRFLRALPDERAGAVDARQVHVSVQLRPTPLVFVSQGTPPWTLLAGNADSSPNLLPVSTLISDLDAERPRFGQAVLSTWQEDTQARRATERSEQLSALRPWLLWAVLILGVAGLAVMVWRLSRNKAS